jgi:hypothetical protein
MLKKVLQFCFLRTCSFYICKTCQGPEADGLPGRATREVILEQVRIGIENIERKRLMAAPDCGLGMLSRRQVKSKLKNMVAAASISRFIMNWLAATHKVYGSCYVCRKSWR